MSNTEIQSENLLEQAKAGHPHALGELLQLHRDQLLRIVKFRMHPRLRGRLDADDIVQDAFIEATERFWYFVEKSEMTFLLWLRYITMQKLFQLHRHHLGVKSRDANRDVSIYAKPHPQATSAALAAHLLGKQTSPSMAAMRAENSMRVEKALNSLNETDREILALRQFERLENQEVAELLNLSRTAASNRYIRALERLQVAMNGIQANESRLS